VIWGTELVVVAVEAIEAVLSVDTAVLSVETAVDRCEDVRPVIAGDVVAEPSVFVPGRVSVGEA
jgi:hypothetical protein